MNGFGLFKWTDGRVYEGDFINGSRHGKGKLLFGFRFYIFV